MMCGFPFYVFFGNKQQLDRNTLIVGTVFQLTWNRRVTCSQSPVKNGERYQRTRLSFDVDYTIVYIPTWWPKLSTLPKHFSFSFPVEIPDKPERVICFLFDEKQTNKQNKFEWISFNYRCTLVCRDCMDRKCGRRRRWFSRHPDTRGR